MEEIKKEQQYGTGNKNRGKYNLNDCKRVDFVTVEKVIVVNVLRGEGIEKDPTRGVKKYFNEKGKFLFEIDQLDCPLLFSNID